VSSIPQEPVDCGFAIEWSAAVLEDIRLAVAEAFSSLPHGGTETGGVLFGTRNGDCVSILASRPLACEHALGPTFTLSEKDHARLRALLEEGGRDLCGQDLEPVGWYRSEIFLSDQDVAIHNRYFPDPWQVALLLRPHALKPVRAGFFFREAGEYISSHREFLLPPAASTPTRPVEQPAPTPPGPGPTAKPSEATARPAPAEIPVLTLTPRRRSWLWLWGAAIILLLGAALFAFKDLAHRRQPSSLSLMAYDLDGQVQIHWDRAAEPIRSAAAGTLKITDGAVSTVVALDKGLLQRGAVCYARQTARVDVRLAVDELDGKKLEEFALSLGRAPANKPATDPKYGRPVRSSPN
jgi:hypothetical protein